MRRTPPLRDPKKDRDDPPIAFAPALMPRSRRTTPPILAFCNESIDRDNWRISCLRLLQQEGTLFPLAQDDEEKVLKRFNFKGAGVTFGNVEVVHSFFRDMFAEIAQRGRFTPHHIELLNASLEEARGFRFQLTRIIPSRRDAPERIVLNPKTFDLNLLLHFIAARFLSGIAPERLKQCPACGRFFFIDDGRRKRFCTDSCRARYHNRQRVDTGRQALYMRRRREKLRDSSGDAECT